MEAMGWRIRVVGTLIISSAPDRIGARAWAALFEGRRCEGWRQTQPASPGRASSLYGVGRRGGGAEAWASEGEGEREGEELGLGQEWLGAREGVYEGREKTGFKVGRCQVQGEARGWLGAG